MKTDWFKGARDGKEKEERRLQVTTGAKALEILTGILEERIRLKETERNSERGYELPGYPYWQADASGYIRALREIQSLINLKEKE